MSVNAVRGKSKSHWTEKATLPFTMGSNSLQNLIEILIVEIFDPLAHGPEPDSSLYLRLFVKFVQLIIDGAEVPKFGTN